jgi:hypothetical protein
MYQHTVNIQYVALVRFIKKVSALGNISLYILYTTKSDWQKKTIISNEYILPTDLLMYHLI